MTCNAKTNRLVKNRVKSWANVDKCDQSQIQKKIPPKFKNEDPEMDRDYISNRYTVWRYLDSKYLDAGLDKEPASELALDIVEQDPDSDEDDEEKYKDDDKMSIGSFGVDIEDMTVDEFFLYSELQSVLGRLNNRTPEDDEEENEQALLADRLIYCLKNVRMVPNLKYEPSLERVRDLARTLDCAESRLATDPRKALENFSLKETLKVKNSLKEVMDKFTQKFCCHTKARASAMRACDKLGNPRVLSSMDKFAQYVYFSEKVVEAFWRNNECVSIVAESGRALNVVKRFETAVRECAQEKEGNA